MQPTDPIAVFPWLRFFPDSKIFQKLKLGIKIRNTLTNRIFNEHIKTFDPQNIRDLTDNLLHLSQKKSIWEDAGFENVTQIQLESIINDLFTAGIETTLTTLRWFLIFILNYPQIQTKIYAEILAKLGKKHQISVADYDKLPYVKAVLHETHRHGSIAPLNLPRKTITDTSVGGYLIPKGTQVFFNLYNIHHDPTYWNEPGKFKPERWLDTDGSFKKEKATHYLPFSAGTRVCLGERMAEIQMFLIVTKLLSNFEISLAPGEPMPSLTETKPAITLEPVKDPRVVLSSRKHFS